MFGIPREYLCRFSGSTVGDGEGVGVGELDGALDLGDSVELATEVVVLFSSSFDSVGLSVGSGDSDRLVGVGETEGRSEVTGLSLSPI